MLTLILTPTSHLTKIIINYILIGYIINYQNNFLLLPFSIGTNLDKALS